jgi:hypothetical protein
MFYACARVVQSTTTPHHRLRFYGELMHEQQHFSPVAARWRVPRRCWPAPKPRHWSPSICSPAWWHFRALEARGRTPPPMACWTRTPWRCRCAQRMAVSAALGAVGIGILLTRKRKDAAGSTTSRSEGVLSKGERRRPQDRGPFGQHARVPEARSVRQASRQKLTLGCPVLDRLLGGGIPCGLITELAGLPCNTCNGMMTTWQRRYSGLSIREPWSCCMQAKLLPASRTCARAAARHSAA